MKWWSCPCRCRRCGVPVLHLDSAPFGGPVLTLERAYFQQPFVVLDLIFGIEPTLTDNIVICLENVDEGCRGGWCATDNGVEEFDFLRGKSREFGC